jgi:hypothetical protein
MNRLVIVVSIIMLLTVTQPWSQSTFRLRAAHDNLIQMTYPQLQTILRSFSKERKDWGRNTVEITQGPSKDIEMKFYTVLPNKSEPVIPSDGLFILVHPDGKLK